MSKADLHRYIKNSEKMISPKEVGGLYQRAEMLQKLPLKLQRFIVNKASDPDAFIGFVVEPYCFFLAYEIADLAEAQRWLPPDYELIPTAMFEGTAPRVCAIIGVFNIHTSVFWGSRIELYLIAENKKTGMLSWLICDYESNTISYDPGQGFSGATTKHAVVTTSFAGEVIIDIESCESANRIALDANLQAGKMQLLTQRLWVEGNLSVDYGGRLIDEESIPFGLIFDPREMTQALHIPLDAVQIGHNTFGDGLLAKRPFEAACFPYAQHFLTTSFPSANPIKTAEALKKAIQQFNEKQGG